MLYSVIVVLLSRAFSIERKYRRGNNKKKQRSLQTKLWRSCAWLYASQLRRNSHTCARVSSGSWSLKLCVNCAYQATLHGAETAYVIASAVFFMLSAALSSKSLLLIVRSFPCRKLIMDGHSRAVGGWGICQPRILVGTEVTLSPCSLRAGGRLQKKLGLAR